MSEKKRNPLAALSIVLGCAVLLCAAVVLGAAVWPIRNPRTVSSPFSSISPQRG